MKDCESRPALKQVRQDDDIDPDMNEPLATIANSYKKTVPIVWSAEAKDPPNFAFNKHSFSYRHSGKRWPYLFFLTVFN